MCPQQDYKHLHLFLEICVQRNNEGVQNSYLVGTHHTIILPLCKSRRQTNLFALHVSALLNDEGIASQFNKHLFQIYERTIQIY